MSGNLRAEQVQDIADEDAPESRREATSLPYTRMKLNVNVVTLMRNAQSGVTVDVKNKVNELGMDLSKDKRRMKNFPR